MVASAYRTEKQRLPSREAVTFYKALLTKKLLIKNEKRAVLTPAMGKHQIRVVAQKPQ